MNFLKSIFVKKRSYSTEANKLLKVAYGTAVSYYMPLIDEYPKFRIIKESELLNEFDAQLTVAIVGAVASQLSYNFNDKETQKYLYAITCALNGWDTNSSGKLVEFGKYLNDIKVNSQEELAQAIGVWVLMGIYEENPHNVELAPLVDSPEATTILGSMVTYNFSNYWTK